MKNIRVSPKLITKQKHTFNFKDIGEIMVTNIDKEAKQRFKVIPIAVPVVQTTRLRSSSQLISQSYTSAECRHHRILDLISAKILNTLVKIRKFTPASKHIEAIEEKDGRFSKCFATVSMNKEVKVNLVNLGFSSAVKTYDVASPVHGAIDKKRAVNVASKSYNTTPLKCAAENGKSPEDILKDEIEEEGLKELILLKIGLINKRGKKLLESNYLNKLRASLSSLRNTCITKTNQKCDHKVLQRHGSMPSLKRNSVEVHPANKSPQANKPNTPMKPLMEETAKESPKMQEGFKGKKLKVLKLRKPKAAGEVYLQEAKVCLPRISSTSRIFQRDEGAIIERIGHIIRKRKINNKEAALFNADDMERNNKLIDSLVNVKNGDGSKILIEKHALKCLYSKVLICLIQ
eukprot:TRINITY_DN16379_c0_g1_i5.p1 TRINITY_DN16379_c0_g1~~TRINITY_DN16379_c0_g1_i5.p1  ORF type:complete len:404 (-),score=31.17 TRINITY_DN16379_c0_g1_i5:197-1408(-)